jgi:uncharacterized protein YbjT (DUF2867 family)
VVALRRREGGRAPRLSGVLVTGGTGMLGSHLVAALNERGHDVRVLSRRPGGGTHRGDLTTGEGVAEAAAGAELVLHAASDTRRLGKRDLDQTRRLLAAVKGARNLVYTSIVGVDAIPIGYYARKLACEREIAASSVPHTILRTTQFHEMLDLALRSVGRLPVAPLPLEWRFQSVAAAEVAERAMELLDAEPLGRAPDFGGPEVLTVAEIVAAWRRRHVRPRRVVNLRLPGRIYRGFREGRNTAPDHRDGRQTWSEFVDGHSTAPDHRDSRETWTEFVAQPASADAKRSTRRE